MDMKHEINKVKTSPDRPHHVRIIYDNGIIMDFATDSFKVTRNPLGDRTWSWGNAEPEPLVLGADNIIAAWVMNRAGATT